MLNGKKHIEEEKTFWIYSSNLFFSSILTMRIRVVLHPDTTSEKNRIWIQPVTVTESDLFHEYGYGSDKKHHSDATVSGSETLYLCMNERDHRLAPPPSNIVRDQELTLLFAHRLLDLN